MHERTVIMGIGNLLRSDDGVGIHAVQELARRPPHAVCVVDAGTDVLSALSYLERARRVLVLDAVRGGADPGTIHRLAETDVLPRRDSRPAHAFSLLDARRLLAPDGHWPELSIVGVEPASVDYGTTLSPAVEAALPRMVALAREIIAFWHQTDDNPPEIRIQL